MWGGRRDRGRERGRYRERYRERERDTKREIERHMNTTYIERKGRGDRQTGRKRQS